MVRAGSLNRNPKTKRVSYVLAAALAFVLCAGLFLGIKGIFVNTNNIQTSTVNTNLHEELITQLAQKTYPILQPKRVPRGFKRTNVEIIGSNKTKSKCEEVLQTFSGTKDPEVGYIDIYSSAQGCSYPRPDDAQMYTVGDYSGWISEPKDESTLIELIVRGGTTRVESDLFQNELSDVLNEFEHFNKIPPVDNAKEHI